MASAQRNFRLVPLDATLLRLAIALERDETTRKTTNIARARIVHGHAFLEGGELIGAGGLVPCWPGRAEAFLFVSSLASQRQIAQGCDVARAILDEAQLDPQFARVEFYVRAGARYRTTFARLIGFTEMPVLMRQWGPAGEDFYLFARVRNKETLAEAA